MFMKDESKEKQEKPKVSTDAVMNEVMKEQKANLFATISEHIEDKSKVGELQKIINGAMDSAFRFGEMSETATTKGDEILSSMENLFNSHFNPANSKYKQLYHNQRIITAHVQSEVQMLQEQVRTLESDGNLFTNIIERMPNVFGCPPTDNVNNAFAAACK